MPRKKGQTVKPKTEAEKAAAEKAKRAKFIELADKRTNTALSAIRSIGKLANSNGYSFSEKDANAITNELTAAVESIQNRFDAAIKGGPTTAEKTFSLAGQD